MTQNIIKLAVGIENVDHLHRRQASRLFDYYGMQATIGWTRRKPKDEAVLKGSMYWVVKGRIAVRQRILGFEPDPEEEIPSWLIVLDPQLIRTIAVPRKPFQGWRYLHPAEAPPDRGPYVPGEQDDETAAPEVAEALRAAGLL